MLARDYFRTSRFRTAAAITAGVLLLIVLILLVIPEGDNPALRIVGVTSSSRQSAANDARLVMDGKRDTAWLTTGKDQGRYEWVRIRFADEVRISKILMINGYARVHPNRWIGDLYERYGRVRSARIALSDRASYFWTLDDNTRGYQTFTLPEPRKTSSVTIYIHNIWKGSVNRELAVSEIKIR